MAMAGELRSVHHMPQYAIADSEDGDRVAGGVTLGATGDLPGATTEVVSAVLGVDEAIERAFPGDPAGVLERSE